MHTREKKDFTKHNEIKNILCRWVVDLEVMFASLIILFHKCQILCCAFGLGLGFTAMWDLFCCCSKALLDIKAWRNAAKSMLQSPPNTVLSPHNSFVWMSPVRLRRMTMMSWTTMAGYGCRLACSWWRRPRGSRRRFHPSAGPSCSSTATLTSSVTSEALRWCMRKLQVRIKN